MIFDYMQLYEVCDTSAIRDTASVAKLLANNRRWKLLYDPTSLIMKQNQDPFMRYWTLLKNFTGAIDLRDFKIGYGIKPVGYGDAKIKLTIDDCISIGYKGWFFLEPSLGRRHGSAVTKAETFALAYQALENLTT